MEGWFNTRNMFQVHFQRFLKIAWKNRFPLQIFCRLKSYLEQHWLNFWTFLMNVASIFLPHLAFFPKICYTTPLNDILFSKFTCSRNYFCVPKVMFQVHFRKIKIWIKGLDFIDFYNKHLYCLDILGNIFAQEFFTLEGIFTDAFPHCEATKILKFYKIPTSIQVKI